MAVKVRCPTCEKVLSAPDSARGKAVKCPGCETKVKVPAGNGSPEGGNTASTAKRTAKAPARKSAEVDSSNFLAQLDLDKVVDSSSGMCPKCGASIPEEATECPACGVDPTTGQLSARARKRKGMKGPDPALFYSLAWTDSWAFLKENFSVAVRTAFYVILAQLITSGCSAMVRYCQTAPPKVFWLSINLATTLALVGWPWHLVIQTIRTTVGRKSYIRDIHFDVFACIALGIKTYLWAFIFCLWFPPAVLMYPLAMIHMAMPVTKRGWWNFLMVSTFFKNLGPALYYWLIWLTLLVISAIVGGIGMGILMFSFGPKFGQLMQNLLVQKPPSGAAEWTIVGLLLCFGVMMALVYGMSEVFKARVIGLMAYYFKDSLDLVVLVAEKEYKRKEVKVDKWGNPIKSTQQKVTEALIVLVILAIVAGAGYWLYLTQFKK